MKNNRYIIVICCAISVLCPMFIEIPLTEETQKFLAALLTVFSIFFGFYMTSYASFSTSDYVSSLHKKQDTYSQKNLLKILLEGFNRAVYCLLASIIYLIVLYVLILVDSSYALYLTWGLWTVLSANFYFIFQTISYFIRVITKSTVQRDG